MIRYQDLWMNNRISPFLVNGLLARSIVNLVSDSPGHLAKRRGINRAVTVGLRIGSAPYNIFQWTYTGGGGGTTLVAVGSNAIAFVNPLNSYLYTRTSAGVDGIWSQPGAGADIATSWGLATPTGSFITDYGVRQSFLDGGVYAYAACGYDATRRVYSPPMFGDSRTVGDDAFQLLYGPVYSIPITQTPAKPTGASHIRVFREQIQAISPATSWLRVRASRWGISGMRLVAENAAGGAGSIVNDTGADYVCIVANTNKQPSANPTFWAKLSTNAAGAWGAGTAYVANGAMVDEGGQGQGELLTFAHTVVPYGGAFAHFDGRMFYGTGLNIYYANPLCPETYAGNTTVQGAPLTPTLAATDDGLMAGEGRILLRSGAGNIVAIASCVDQGLALCQYGSWSLIRLGDGVSYGAAQDMLSVGCSSRQTVCQTPYGVLWLSPDGIALWTGQGPPAVLTRDWLDLYGTEIGAATDLSGAMAAYDFKRNRYVCAVPKAAGGFTIIVLHMDRLESQQFCMRTWTLAHTTPLVGMGWDPTTMEVVFYFFDGQQTYTAQVARDSSYKDIDQATGTTYQASLDLVWNGGEKEVLRNPTLTIVPYRATASSAQSVAVTMRGMPVDDAASGSARGPFTLTWGASEYSSKSIEMGVSGKLIKIGITHQDALPFDVQELQLGETSDMIMSRNG